MNYKVVMAYDGTRYNGWQKQGNTDKTIQGKLEQILLKMTGEEIEVHGSGRTDAGVHAKGQVANFHIDWKELEKNGKKLAYGGLITTGVKDQMKEIAVVIFGYGTCGDQGYKIYHLFAEQYVKP